MFRRTLESMSKEPDTATKPPLTRREEALVKQLSENIANAFKVSGVIEPSGPAFADSAIALCAMAWQVAYLKVYKDKSRYFSEKAAAKAFRGAMPPLCGKENIANFVTCVSYGILIGAIKPDESGKLLYAAQVAIGIHARPEPQPKSAA
jgi:hypothetical protein